MIAMMRGKRMANEVRNKMLGFSERFMIVYFCLVMNTGSGEYEKSVLRSLD